MVDQPVQVIRWTTPKGRSCAAMVPEGRELTDQMREQLTTVADGTEDPDMTENAQFHFTVSFEGD